MPPTTVFRAGALGDFVVTVPALRELFAERGPLCFVGNATAARELAPELFASVESIDEPRWAGLFDDATPLPAADGDAVVLLRDAEAAERLQRYGWRVDVHAQPFPTTPNQHVAAHLLSSIGKADAIPRRRCAANLLPSGRIGEGEYAVVHPGSGSARKNWPPERFAEVINRLQVPSVIVSGPADAAPTDVLLQLCCASVTSPRSLSDLRAVLTGAVLYLGNDSGVSHVAAGLGVPTVAVFGPTRAVRWAPWGPLVRTVEPVERCDLCRMADERPVACRCIDSITVADVLAVA